MLRDLLGRARDILAEHFFGLYLYGSLAVGDFYPSRSDIDFVVVTRDHLPDTIIRELESMHMALAAEWAVATLPTEWSSLINHALQWGAGDEIESINQTAAFMDYVIELCRISK